MDKHKFVNYLRIVTCSLKIKTKFDKIETKTGVSESVYEGHIIQLLSKTLQFSYDIILEDLPGELSPDGNWTGCIGRIQREEADIAICTIPITENKSKIVRFTNPYIHAPITFVTDKPQNIKNRFAMFNTFSWPVWFALAVCFLFMSFFIYFFFRKKQNYSSALLYMFGILVGQQLRFKSGKSSTRLITLSWLIGVMCLTYSYKSVLLASLSFPLLSGVRDIKDLSIAAQNPSFQCYTDRRSFVYKALVESDNEIIKPIGKCLKRTPEISNFSAFLLNPSYKKAAIYGKRALYFYKRKLFFSDDAFFTGMGAIAVSKKFRYFDVLNDALLRIYESGFFQAYESHIEFLYEMGSKTSDYENPPSRILRIENLFGDFIILIAGLNLSTLIFVFEIVLYRLTKSLKRNPLA